VWRRGRGDLASLDQRWRGLLRIAPNPMEEQL
jgi:hypothetical protein